MRFFSILVFILFLATSGSSHAETLDGEAALSAQQTDNLDNLLLSIIKSRNGGEIGKDLIRLRQTPAFLKVDFSLIEGRLRKLGTEIYLVAVPFRYHEMVTSEVKSVAPDSWTSRSAAGQTAEDLPFFLWVEVNGREKYLRKLTQLGIDGEMTNLENLKRTGILTPKR